MIQGLWNIYFRQYIFPSETCGKLTSASEILIMGFAVHLKSRCEDYWDYLRPYWSVRIMVDLRVDYLIVRYLVIVGSRLLWILNSGHELNIFGFRDRRSFSIYFRPRGRECASGEGCGFIFLIWDVLLPVNIWLKLTSRVNYDCGFRCATIS